MSNKKIKPFPGNPRKITPERLRTLGESLNEYGSLDGFVVNVGPGKYENCIISGNQKNKHINLAKAKIDITERYETPTETGTVAIGHVTHNGELFPYREVVWDDRKCEIGNIRANNLGGRNDVDLLNQFEADILEAGGIDMDFEMFIDTFMVGDGEGGIPNNALNSEAQEDDFEPPAEIEEIKTDIVLGDLFEIGPHRLLCGDSTKAEDVERLMGGEKAETCFTSPPYNLGKNISLSTRNKKNNAYTSYDDNQEDDAYFRLLKEFTDNALLVCSVVIVNIQSLANNKKTVIRYQHKYIDRLADISVWVKSNPQPAMAAKVMNSAFEYFIFLSNKHHPNRAIETANFHGTFSNVYYGTVNSENVAAEIHKASFPLSMCAEFIRNFSSKSIVDFFIGTGTTMVAAHQLNRRCFGMEIDPKYCQVILDRMRKLRPDIEIKKNGQPYEPNTQN